MNKSTRIDGFGTIAGGHYENISINGTGTILGDCECIAISINGNGKCDGKLVCKDLHVNGSGKCQDIEAEYLKINGGLKVVGNIKTKKLNIDGGLSSEVNKIYANRIKVNGVLKNNDEVNADEIDVDGKIIAANLFGDVIKISYNDRLNIFDLRALLSKVNDIFMTPFHYNKVDTIECTTLYANYLTAAHINAHDITLGKSCDIDEIYCDGTLRHHENCKIRNITGNPTIIIQ